MEVLHAPFVQAPLPLVDSGEIPHLRFAPCIDAQCARCDGSLGGFKFPFIGTWCRRAVLAQEGASADEAWAAYHGCYEGDRLSEAMVAEAGSGLRAQDIISMYVSAIAGRVESGDLPFVSFRGFMGTWRRWSLGARRWTEPWPRESDSLARATAKAGIANLEEFRFFFDAEAKVEPWLGKIQLGAEAQIQAARLRRAWHSVSLYYKTAEQDRSRVAIEDSLLGDTELRSAKEAFWVRYKLKFPTEVYPSDAAVSRASREMSKRLLCVTAVWKVKTLQWQLGTSSKKRKLGDGGAR